MDTAVCSTRSARQNLQIVLLCCWSVLSSGVCFLLNSYWMIAGFGDRRNSEAFLERGLEEREEGGRRIMAHVVQPRYSARPNVYVGFHPMRRMSGGGGIDVKVIRFSMLVGGSRCWRCSSIWYDARVNF